MSERCPEFRKPAFQSRGSTGISGKGLSCLSVCVGGCLRRSKSRRMSPGRCELCWWELLEPWLRDAKGALLRGWLRPEPGQGLRSVSPRERVEHYWGISTPSCLGRADFLLDFLGVVFGCVGRAFRALAGPQPLSPPCPSGSQSQLPRHSRQVTPTCRRLHQPHLPIELNFKM